jgi:hypothetical protein
MKVRQGLLNIGNSFLWTYVFGPFLALLPRRWRLMWFSNRPIEWPRATLLSGLLEFVTGTFALMLWMAWETCRIGTVMGAGCSGGPFQLFSLVLASLNPVTWAMFYLIFEGIVRIASVLFLNDAPGTAILGVYLFVRDRVENAEPQIPDEVIEEVSNQGWKLRIESSRPKRDWSAGRRLCYKDRFYRIVSFSMKSGPRPYVFTLEGLPTGVKSRRVILYSLDPAAPSSQPR